MRLCKLALVFGVVALLASPALAQPGRGMFGNPGMLVRIPKVQKDLDLSKENADKAAEAARKVFMDNRDEFQKLLSPDTSAEDKAALQKKLREATDKALKEVLTDKQIKRLKQITMQMQGPAMFQDGDVQKALKLNDKQKDQIKEINQNYDKEMADLRPAAGTKPDLDKIQENFKKMENLRKDAMSSAAKALTADQKKELKELTGAPLELTLQDFFSGFSKPRQ